MVTRIGPKKPIKIFISYRREDQKLSQEQLANRIGTTKGSISRWENNERDITLGALGAIAEALGCDVVDLLTDPAQPSADALMRDMDDATRRQALRLIEALKKTGTDD
jgi:transcriptional regulator with XRE-family HTH domain